MNYSKQQISHQVIEAIRKIIAPEVSQNVSSDSKLIGDLGIDSLKIAELSLLLEETFKITLFIPAILSSVPDPYLLTVESVADFVENKLQELA